MKAKFLLTLMTVALTTACSSDKDINNDDPGLMADEYAKINIGVSAGEMTTRGTGSVGGTSTADNHWAGQTLNIYMMEKGSMELALFGLDGTKTVIFDNKKFHAPDSLATGDAVCEDLKVAYYPQNGTFDFWGYHIDNAGTGANGTAVPEFRSTDGSVIEISSSASDATKNEARENATCVVVPFEIDGSQDIMSGKAPAGSELSLPSGLKADKVYSASAARKDVQPNIMFQHHLTRFTFHLIAGNPEAAGVDTTGAAPVAEAIYVDTITLKSKTKGELYVAYLTKPAKGVCQFVDDSLATLTLKQRDVDASGNALYNSNLKNLKSVPLTWSIERDGDGNITTNQADTVTVGEALLVAPGELTYPLSLSLSQKVGGTTKKFNFKADVKINNAAFQAGASYDVIIKVYGLQKIGVTTTLQRWTDGGDINIDTDTEEQQYVAPTV